MACGGPREALPGVPIEGTSVVPVMPAIHRHGVQSLGLSAAGIGLRLVGYGSALVGSMVGGFIGMVDGMPHGLLPFGLISAASFGVGFAFHRWGKSVDDRAQQVAASGDELRVLSLASQMGGELYVTDVARSLGVSTAEAEKILSSMVDGSRVVADLSSDGLLRFEFRELRRRGPAVRARVEAPAENEGVEVESASRGARDEASED